LNVGNRPGVVGNGEWSRVTERPISIAMPDDGRTIRGLVVDGGGPAVVWLGGFRSDMTGTKAEAVAAWGQANGRKVVRFDYSGHGASAGNFEDGRIGRWFEEAKTVVAAEAGLEFILVGSSMGGWMALLLARAHLRGLKGVVLVAPAPDFTDKLFYPALPADVRARVDGGETIDVPGEYGSPAYRLTADFFRDGARHNLLDAPLRLGVPVIIIQGMADASVPWSHAQRIVDCLVDDDVVLTLVKDGDHRLSRPSDIALILDAIGRVTED
jgi:pimeloyl-ACP methyl ester carboxylesterase